MELYVCFNHYITAQNVHVWKYQSIKKSKVKILYEMIGTFLSHGKDFSLFSQALSTILLLVLPEPSEDKGSYFISLCNSCKFQGAPQSQQNEEIPLQVKSSS